jgi:hypothetical protein
MEILEGGLGLFDPANSAAVTSFTSIRDLASGVNDSEFSTNT